ncbi:MAG: PASTA domain-containing protein [Prevotella sp.]|nr:PASTA domain-containing protein [Prevotella sp.]
MKAKKFFRKFASWHLWLNLLGMVAVVVMAFVGLKWWLLKYTHHGEGIEVPDLYGKNYLEAQEAVAELGLRIEANDSTYIKEMPAGSIVVQSPSKGMNVKEGRIIYVTINSLTIPRVRIPDIVDNCSYREAIARLQALDLHVLPPKLIDGEKDWVYGIKMDGRDIHVGDMVARESQLVLVIGNGSWNETGDDDFYELPPLGNGDDESTQDDPANGYEGPEDDFVPVDPRELEMY